MTHIMLLILLAFILYFVVSTILRIIMFNTFCEKANAVTMARLAVASAYYPSCVFLGMSDEHNKKCRHVIPAYARTQDRLRYLQLLDR